MSALVPFDCENRAVQSNASRCDAKDRAYNESEASYVLLGKAVSIPFSAGGVLRSFPANSRVMRPGKEYDSFGVHNPRSFQAHQ
jgi:hypothetical protein